MLNYKVIVIGDKLKIKGVKNKGFISNNEFDSLQKISSNKCAAILKAFVTYLHKFNIH